MAQYSKINMMAGLYEAFAFETITISSTAKSLTSSSYKDSGGNIAQQALITVETAQIRSRWDGGVPTATVGHLSNPMNSIILTGQDNIKNYKAIRKSTTDAKIFVTYSR